jgi:hypothetical protein
MSGSKQIDYEILTENPGGFLPDFEGSQLYLIDDIRRRFL